MKTINLSDEVMVSDPCYEVPTWCQQKLTGVLPGEYIPNALIVNDWGQRVAVLKVVHKDHNSSELTWRTITSADIGVDSGQCGIFSMETYRNDILFKEQPSEFYGTYEDVLIKQHRKESGDHWYGHMCDRTLAAPGWGTYSNGVVSSSGYGDGSYRLLVAKSKGKIVGIAIDYHLITFPNSDLNHMFNK